MTRLMLDSETSRQLAEAGPRVELCDESGRVLGRFVAVEDRSSYADVEIPNLSEEELERRRRAPRYTTDEVVAHLERPRNP